MKLVCSEPDYAAPGGCGPRWLDALQWGALSALNVRPATIQSPAVLVVDDDVAIRETLHQLLDDEGYAIEQAPDGVVALEILHTTSRPMVVLLDMMMPRLDGSGVLRAVAADVRLARRLRFIIMTAAESILTDEVAQLMWRLDAIALIKPFGIDQLLALVAEASASLSE